MFLISPKFHGDWPNCYETINGSVAVVVYAYQQFYACKHGADEWRDCDEIDISQTGMNAITINHALQSSVGLIM